MFFLARFASLIAFSAIAGVLLDPMHPALAADAAKPAPSASPKATPAGKAAANGAKLETYQNLIQKAQNLTLQRDRLQASQVLIRGLQRETKGSVAHRELSRALDDLTSVFYTEKAQSLFASAESLAEEKPREAIEQFNESLRVEENNLAALKSLARVQLRLAECDAADASVKRAETTNPFSAEVRLLRLQVLSCQKSTDLLGEKLAAKDIDMEPVEKFTKGLQIQDLLRRKEAKKAKALQATWEAQSSDYPEVYFWKWEISKQNGSTDRVAALKYLQLCQNMTPRKRKSYVLDVDLCKSKEVVDTYLKDSGAGAQSTPPAASEGKDD